MIAEAMRYEKSLQAIGDIEYDGENKVVLRTADVKTADLSGSVRLYFDNRRDQVMTGRRFDPMSSNLVLMRPGMFYRVYSNIAVIEPLPAGVSALVVLNNDVADVLMITTGPFLEGFIGQVCFTVQPFRKLEMEKMTSLGNLMFFEDVVVPVGVDEKALKLLVKSEVKRTLKNGNSDRTKKTSGSTKKKPTPKPKVEDTDAGSVPDEHPDDPES